MSDTTQTDGGKLVAEKLTDAAERDAEIEDLKWEIESLRAKLADREQKLETLEATGPDVCIAPVEVTTKPNSRERTVTGCAPELDARNTPRGLRLVGGEYEVDGDVPESATPEVKWFKDPPSATLDEIADTRETGFKGRVVFDASSGEVLDFEAVDELMDTCIDTELLNAITNPTKDTPTYRLTGDLTEETLRTESSARDSSLDDQLEDLYKGTNTSSVSEVVAWVRDYIETAVNSELEAADTTGIEADQSTRAGKVPMSVTGERTMVIDQLGDGTYYVSPYKYSRRSLRNRLEEEFKDRGCFIRARPLLMDIIDRAFADNSSWAPYSGVFE